jgi:hypothetical protein
MVSKLTPSLNALSKTLFSIRGDGVVSESCVAVPLLSTRSFEGLIDLSGSRAYLLLCQCLAEDVW